MGNSKKPRDFEDRFFDALENTMGGMDKKIDAVVADQKDDRKRIDKLWDAVFPNQVESTKSLPSWWRDPNIIKLLTFLVGAVILVVSLAAALLGQPLPNVLTGS